MTAFGKFRLEERLGQGGMGEVWRAVERTAAGSERTVVLKRILPHLVSDPEMIAMFRREARVCAQLDHANVVRMLEFGDVNREYYLSMEFVAGVDLWKIIREARRLGPTPPGFAVHIVRDVCRALHYAHGLQIMHRDVTPSNVVVAFDGGVKLLDFGIAKALSMTTEARTQTGNLKGKFGYMSPEQVEGGSKSDHRADQFAAGVVLHETLTGLHLFRGETDLDTIALVRNAHVQSPSLWNPLVPPWLDSICLRALSRDPKDRYADCGELATALDKGMELLEWNVGETARFLENLFPGRDTRLTHVAVQLDGHDGGATTPQAATPVVDPLPAPGKPVGRLAGLGVAALIVVIIALVSLRPRAKPDVSPPSPSPAPSAAAMPAPPALAKVKIVTTPPGARVFLDEEAAPRGVSPLVLELAPRKTESKVILRLDGYETGSLSFTPDRDALLQTTLLPAPVKKFTKTTAQHPASKKTKTPDLRRLDVVDPFGR